MMRLWLALATTTIGCDHPSATTVPATLPPTPEACAAYDYEGSTFDCGDLTGCSSDPIELRLACCECDPALCTPLECTPPDFPPDEGPEVAFSRPLLADLELEGWSMPLQVVPSAAGVVLVPDHVAAAALEVPCTRTLNTLDCPGTHTLRPAGYVQLHGLQLRLSDTDGDGVADAGLHRSTANVDTIFASDAMFGPLRADLEPGAVAVVGPLLPTEEHTLTLSEPVGIGVAPTVAIGGQPVLATPVAGPAGLVVGFRIQASRAWGVDLVVGPMTDLAGNPIPGTVAQIVDDPGPWTANAGFEDPVGGWAIVGGTLGVPPDGPDPFEGIGVASFPQTGAMAGRLTLPADATTVSFAHAWLGFADPTVRVELWSDAGDLVLWSFDPAVDAAACAPDCGAWATETVDVTALAGEDVLLRVAMATGVSPLFVPAPPPPASWLALDDVSVQTPP